MSYLHEGAARLERIQACIEAGIPVAHEDDETLEHNLGFMLLSREQQLQVEVISDPLAKRQQIVDFHKVNQLLAPE